MADCSNISKEPNIKSSNFICGVVEGFYGRPWTTDQRKDLFQKMKKWGMDSYVYAPKDDYKHRAYWRELYTVEEAEHLTGLISAARAQGIEFYYALSPGLDIQYSSQKEVTVLKRKLEQVSRFGCTAFALLFDDIEPEMSEADKEIFQSFAHAQVSVTNEVQQHLGGSAVRFLLCPTQYCGTRAIPSVTASEYLTTLGAKLSIDIDIMWTGSKVISKILTAACIEEITQVLRRPPVIWDNLHANDYDQKRMFLGPYSGRSPELIPLLRGVLSNPNCEYNANTVPIRTLAHWANCSVDASTNNSVAADIKLESEGGGGDDEAPRGISKHVYHHRQALRKAVAEWLPEFSIEKSAFGPIVKPQPVVNITEVPIIPILPSVNTCMTLTSTTATTSTSASRTIPTVNTSQLQALADICTTASPVENFIPAPNPIMNSLVSPTKVITNDSIPNPITPLVSSNLALPSEIPVTTIQVPIMGMKSFGDGEIIGTDPLKNQIVIPIIDQEADQQMVEVSTDKTEKPSVIPTCTQAVQCADCLDVRVGDFDKELCNKVKSVENGVQTALSGDEDTGDIVVDDLYDKIDGKDAQNGAMSIGESPCTLSPHATDTAMECTPEHETTALIEASDSVVSPKEGEEAVINAGIGSPGEDIDIVMTDGSNENGPMQVELLNSPSNSDMMVESNDDSADVLTVEDLMLLCDLFYLPFEHGSQALRLLQDFNWLKVNAPVLLSNKDRNGLNKAELQEWHVHARRFGLLCGRVARLARRLGRCHNREMLHDLWAYLWDLRAVVGMLHSYVKWLALGKFPPNICNYTQGSYTWFSKGWKEAFMSGDQEPWVFRGGLIADLQRLMPIDNGNDLLAYRAPTSPSCELYVIRPYIHQDNAEICTICHKTCKDGMDCSELYPPDLQTLPEDVLIGPYLQLYPELFLIAQEESPRPDGSVARIMGYACAAPDARTFLSRRASHWAPLMKEKYPALPQRVPPLTPTAEEAMTEFHSPSVLVPEAVWRHHPALMSAALLPHCSDHSALKRLITCLLAALRANGSFGVHACIKKEDHYMNQFYTKLGFVEIAQDSTSDCVYLGRTF